MRTIRDASEDEVVAAFLQAEIDSDRHAQKILSELHADGRPKSIVDSPDFEDHDGNAYRRSILGRVRGWSRCEGMFQGFPDRVVWALAALAPQELADVRYIAWDWWLERSGGSRLAAEYARRIRAGCSLPSWRSISGPRKNYTAGASMGDAGSWMPRSTRQSSAFRVRPDGLAGVDPPGAGHIDRGPSLSPSLSVSPFATNPNPHGDGDRACG